MEHHSHEVKITSKEEAKALFSHMIHHNEHHAEEMESLSSFVKENFPFELASRLNSAVEQMKQANEALKKVCEEMEKE